MTKRHLIRPLAPYKDALVWENETRSYIARMKAMLSGASLPGKLELPPARVPMESFLQVRLKRFTNKNAEQYEVGRVISFQGDPRGRAFAVLPTIPGKKYIWVLRVGEQEHSYTPAGRSKPTTKTIDVVRRNSHEHISHFDSRIEALHAEAMALFDVQVADAALKLIDDRFAPWPLEPVGLTLQKYMLDDLLRGSAFRISNKIVKNSASINDMAVDNLRIFDRKTTSEAVAIVHERAIERQKESATGEAASAKSREIVSDYRNRFTKRKGKPIDSLIPSAKYPGRDIRHLIADINLTQSVDRVLSELHLHARHRIAIDALRLILRDEYRSVRKAWLSLPNRRRKRVGTTAYQVILTARDRAVSLKRMSAEGSKWPRKILQNSPSLLEGLLANPVSIETSKVAVETGLALSQVIQQNP